ncbi:transposase, partial [Candidatus Woesearchaeota archaeon]|nr:transposase [Candidatus Woesearchaeota archaeon]
AGIDSTGLQPTRASAYYTKVLKKDRKKRRKIHKHIKLSTVIDLDHQLPMSFKIRRGPASDHLDSLSLVRKAHRIKKIKSLDADKGYTKEALRKFVVEKCDAEDRIKFKNPEVPIWRTKGEYLKKAKRRKLRANYRAKCETYHSVLKRITGSTLRAIKVINYKLLIILYQPRINLINALRLILWLC